VAIGGGSKSVFRQAAAPRFVRRSTYGDGGKRMMAGTATFQNFQRIRDSGIVNRTRTDTVTFCPLAASRLQLSFFVGQISWEVIDSDA
jgi:hypothetical protein